MPLFRVYEVQEETVTRQWLWEIEADDAEQALERVQAGEVDPIDCGTMGDSILGPSGWCAHKDGAQDGEQDYWQRALDDMSANLP